MVKFLRRILHLLLTSEPSREKQILTIGLSILVATLLWVIVTLNLEYESTFSFPVRVEAVPDSIHINELHTRRVSVVASGLGVDLLIEHLRPRRDTVGVPFDQAVDQQVYLGSRAFRNRMDRFFVGKLEIKDVMPGQVRLDYAPEVSRKVPVRFTTEVRLKPTYQLRHAPRLRDDSVVLYGPQAALDTILEWPTAPGYVMVDRESRIRIPLAQAPPGITLDPKAVEVAVSPQRYTEAKVSVPISIVDTPKNVSVRLDHRQVAVSCLIPVDDYQILLDSMQRYRLEIPFELLNPELPYLIPPLQLPEAVKPISRQPQFLSYVIVEELPLAK